MSNYLDDMRLLMEVSVMYYEEGYKQVDIGKKHNISRSLVSRYLTKAREIGLVEITVHKNLVESNFELEKEVRSKFNLTHVVCVDYHEDKEILRSRIADEANSYFLRMVEQDSTVAITGGTTVNLMSKRIRTKSLFPDVDFVSMTGGLGNESKDIHANLICDNFATRLGAKATSLYAPALVDSIKAREVFLKQTFIKEVLDKAKNADILLTGVGGLPSYSTLATAYLNQIDTKDTKNNEKIVGDFCYNFIDQEGKLIDLEWNERVITLGIKQMKDIPLVIAVAEGEEKVACIQAAIKAGLINTLVTDVETAKLLLKE